MKIYIKIIIVHVHACVHKHAHQKEPTSWNTATCWTWRENLRQPLIKIPLQLFCRTVKYTTSCAQDSLSVFSPKVLLPLCQG